MPGGGGFVRRADAKTKQFRRSPTNHVSRKLRVDEEPMRESESPEFSGGDAAGAWRSMCGGQRWGQDLRQGGWWALGLGFGGTRGEWCSGLPARALASRSVAGPSSPAYRAGSVSEFSRRAGSASESGGFSGSLNRRGCPRFLLHASPLDFFEQLG